MYKNNQTGRKGEDIAYEYLINKGFLILKRNYLKKFGEIDLIGKAADSTLVFIEVKTLLNKTTKGNGLFKPEDNLITQKYNNVNRMAQFFVGDYPQLINEEKGWRIDLVAIEIFELDGSFSVRHYENI